MEKTITIDIPVATFFKAASGAHKLDITLNEFVERALDTFTANVREGTAEPPKMPKFIVGDVIRHHEAHERNQGSVIQSLSPEWDAAGLPIHNYFVQSIDDHRKQTIREVDAVLVMTAAEYAADRISVVK